jgi:hypothetical protein
MAHVLHCDGCHAQDGSIDGNVKLTTNQAAPRIKVWKNVKVYGKEYDLCNRCVGKINAVLQLPNDVPLDGPMAPKALVHGEDETGPGWA